MALRFMDLELVIASPKGAAIQEVRLYGSPRPEGLAMTLGMVMIYGTLNCKRWYSAR